MKNKDARLTWILAVIASGVLLTSCAATATQTSADMAASASVVQADTTTDEAFDSSQVHDFAVTFDSDEYDAMIAEYQSTGDKEWLEATVTIDSQTYEQVGIRLKGNSSLRSLSGAGGGQPAVTESPQDLPWLIKLDKYVDQSHDGVTDFVVRSNTTQTSLNEAVALELLQSAGLASQDAMAVRFSINGSDETLRLVIENPDDVWMAETLGASGALYKAESTGDYSYRGDDPDAYEGVFDQEAGKENADLVPLIDFLEFINDDEAFAAEIDQRLDVDSFATYLAMQDVVSNFDDIDGPGNNSYLYYDTETGMFTVVPWDYNMAFGLGPGGAGGGGFGPPADASAPEGLVQPEGLAGGQRPAPPQGLVTGDPQTAGQALPGAAGGGPISGSNVLVERLMSDDDFAALVEARTSELTSSLIDSGVADEILAQWVEVLQRDASDLVADDIVTTEAEAVSAAF